LVASDRHPACEGGKMMRRSGGAIHVFHYAMCKL
jgi:hypothetical protein